MEGVVGRGRWSIVGVCFCFVGQIDHSFLIDIGKVEHLIPIEHAFIIISIHFIYIQSNYVLLRQQYPLHWTKNRLQPHLEALYSFI